MDVALLGFQLLHAAFCIRRKFQPHRKIRVRRLRKTRDRIGACQRRAARNAVRKAMLHGTNAKPIVADRYLPIFLGRELTHAFRNFGTAPLRQEMQIRLPRKTAQNRKLHLKRRSLQNDRIARRNLKTVRIQIVDLQIRRNRTEHEPSDRFRPTDEQNQKDRKNGQRNQHLRPDGNHREFTARRNVARIQNRRILEDIQKLLPSLGNGRRIGKQLDNRRQTLFQLRMAALQQSGQTRRRAFFRKRLDEHDPCHMKRYGNNAQRQQPPNPNRKNDNHRINQHDRCDRQLERAQNRKETAPKNNARNAPIRRTQLRCNLGRQLVKGRFAITGTGRTRHLVATMEKIQFHDEKRENKSKTDSGDSRYMSETRLRRIHSAVRSPISNRKSNG